MLKIEIQILHMVTIYLKIVDNHMKILNLISSKARKIKKIKNIYLKIPENFFYKFDKLKKK